MATPSGTSDRPLVVVIADDEDLLRQVAREALEDEGFITFTAENAIAALEICRSQAEAVDVLFTDIRMPGRMDGLELAHRVRERWPWILIIITSGNVFVGRDQLPEGAYFERKPYDVHQIADHIRMRRHR
jgi:CheY-like chemotaxis protein